MLNVKIKKLRDGAKAPAKGTEDAAGYDLYAAEETWLFDGIPTKIPTGLAFEIPPGYCGVVYSRSSSFLKRILCTPLIVDADYRGEVYVSAWYSGVVHLSEHSGANTTHYCYEPKYLVKKGDRIAQIKFEKLEDVLFEETDKLSETKRGSGGYGSTGN